MWTWLVLLQRGCDIAGDLTHAKFANEHHCQQFEEEWKEYGVILSETKVTERQPWLDIRGNHGQNPPPPPSLYWSCSHRSTCTVRTTIYVWRMQDMGHAFSVTPNLLLAKIVLRTEWLGEIYRPVGCLWFVESVHVLSDNVMLHIYCICCFRCFWCEISCQRW